MKVLKEQFPYRWCETEDHDRGWIEKFNYTTGSYINMYECDSPLQLMTAMEDVEYTKWLDPTGVPSYRKHRGDVIMSYHRAMERNND